MRKPVDEPGAANGAARAVGHPDDHRGRLDLRLVPAAVLAWLGGWWSVGASSQAVLVVVGVCVLVGAAVLSAVVLPKVSGPTRAARPWAAAAATALTAATAALAVTGLHLVQRERDPVGRWAPQRPVVELAGRVSADPQPVASPRPRFGRGQSWVLHVEASTVDVRGRRLASDAQTVLIADRRWSGLAVGSHVVAGGRLAPADPGQSAQALLMVRGPPRIIDRGGWPWRVAEHLRAGLRQACTGLPGGADGLLPGLVVGDTSRLAATLRADMQTAGLTHLTAVSGSNVTILAGSVTLVLAGAGAGRRVRFTGTALSVVAFVVLARPEPSVLRAAVMGTLALVGVLLARRASGVPVLAVTVIGLLLADPWLARSYGFALSVLATAALLVLAPAWVRRRDRRLAAEGRQPAAWRTVVVAAIAVPLAAQLVTAPVTLLLNPVVSLAAVPANLLVAPAVAPATVCGVVAALVAPLSAGAAHWIAWPGGLATAWIAVVARAAAGLPGATLPWPGGPAGAALLVGVTLAGLMVAQRSRRPVRTGAVLAGSLVLVVGCTGTGVPLLPGGVLLGRGLRPDWVVVQCDVGQGSATLIRSGPRRALLVDAGPDSARVDRCLRLARVGALDLVLLTHFHADHVGGLAGALRGRGRPPVLVSTLAQPADQARSVARLAVELREAPVPVGVPLAGTAGAGRWQLRWQALPPQLPAHLVPDASDPDGTVVNDASLVLRFQVQGLTVVVLGDVETEAQQVLARQSPAPADVVVVAHHGSSRQYPPLYRQLRPRLALIGVGLDNDYGHPAPQALAMLHGLGAVVGRTDRQGTLAVSRDGGGPALRLTAARTG